MTDDKDCKSHVCRKGRTSISMDFRYGWKSMTESEFRCHFIGHFIFHGVFYKDEAAAKELIRLFSAEHRCEQISLIIDSFQGNFAFILETNEIVIAAVDKVRSFPVFYYHHADQLFISNSARLLQQENNLYQWNKDALIEYKMTGYVTGSETLFQNLRQIRAGEFLEFQFSPPELSTYRYYTFYSALQKNQPEKKWIEELASVMDETFRDLIRTLDGRPVWIPLSGGLDSRLVIAMLKDLGYRNLTAFSYGLPNNWQAAVARQVAESLNVKWFFIPFTRKRTARLHTDAVFADHIRFADGLCTVPMLPDFFALRHLQNSGRIPPDAVMINGQSGDFITGGHIPSMIPRPVNSWKEFIHNAIIDKHCSLWLNHKTDRNLQLIKKRLQFNFINGPIVDGPQEVADAYEKWEWEERQSKFVVNGQRAYDFFNLEWRLPLWSDQNLHFWTTVPWQLKFGQNLYKLYLKHRDPCGVFSRKWLNQYITPRYIPLISTSLAMIAKLFQKEYIPLEKQYLKYFMEYSPFYSYMSYPAYLKSSKLHRNAISYYALEVLKRIESDLKTPLSV